MSATTAASRLLRFATCAHDYVYADRLIPTAADADDDERLPHLDTDDECEDACNHKRKRNQMESEWRM